MNNYSFVEKLTVAVSIIAMLISLYIIQAGIFYHNGLIALAGSAIVCTGIIALAIISRNK